MANENFKERVDLVQTLNILEQEYGDTAERGNTTIKDRVGLMQRAVAFEKDNNELTKINKDLQSKANEFKKKGNTQLAKQYRNLSLNVTKQITNNKLNEAAAKLEKEKSEKAKKFADVVNNGAKSLAGIVGLGGGIVALFTKFNGLTRVIGQEFGALGMQNQQFKNDVLDASVNATKLGKSIEDVTKVTKSLTTQFGFSRDEALGLSNDIIDTSLALGVTTEEGTKLIGTLMQISGLSSETAQNFAKQTQLLAETAGAAPNAVLKDLAESSETIAKFTGITPDNLAKAAIQANKLGLSLKDIGGVAEGLLNFQDSLNKEIEASILLGRDLNLTKARELALNNDLEGVAVEITKQVGDEAEFNKLNLIQRRALAESIGISVEQLAKVVTNQSKVKTLGDAISEQPGLEGIIGQNAIDNIAKIVNNLQVVGAQLATSIGPTVATIAGGFASVLGALQETGALLPVITTLMGLMAGKSALNFAFSIATALGKQAKFMGPLGIGLILGIPALVGTLVGSVASVPRFQNLDEGTMASIEGGPGIFDSGETVVRTTSLENMMKPVVEALDRLIVRQEDTTSAIRRIGGDTASALGDM